VLQKGDVVQIVRYYPLLGWSFGRCERSKESGFLPNNYLEKTPDDFLSKLQWQKNDYCLAQHAPGEWKRGKILEVSEKSCKIVFLEDGLEKVVGSLGITPDHVHEKDEGPNRPEKKNGADLWGKLRTAVQKDEQILSDMDSDIDSIMSGLTGAKEPEKKKEEEKNNSAKTSKELQWEMLQKKMAQRKEKAKSMTPVSAQPVAQRALSARREDCCWVFFFFFFCLFLFSFLGTSASEVAIKPIYNMGDSCWVCNMNDKWVKIFFFPFFSFFFSSS
jgi:hypothetical protein